ncbi:MAG: hypothetical protein R2856_15940 [Caldilineaceae bacterium]
MPRYIPDYDEYDEAYADDYFERGHYEAKTQETGDDLIPGVVIHALGHHYDVETEDGLRQCRVRGRLLQERARIPSWL